MTWLDAMRWHQWYKGIWVYLPLLGHEGVDRGNISRLFVAFLLVTLVSSSVYLTNDILDYERDKAHPKRKFRPFASGKISRRDGKIAIMVILVCAGALIYILRSPLVAAFAIVMVLGNLLYSKFIKHFAYFEIVLYAMLFPIRYWIGAVLVHSEMWLAHSIFVSALAVFFLVTLRYSEKVQVGAIGRATLQQYSEMNLARIMILSSIITSLTHYLITSFLGVQGVVATLIVVILFCRYILICFSLGKRKNAFIDIDAMFLTDSTLVIASILYGIIMLL